MARHVIVHRSSSIVAAIAKCTFLPQYIVLRQEPFITDKRLCRSQTLRNGNVFINQILDQGPISGSLI